MQILNLYPNLNTRTRLPMAETRDLKVFPTPTPVPAPLTHRVSRTFAQELRSDLHLCTAFSSLSLLPSGQLANRSTDQRHSVLSLQVRDFSWSQVSALRSQVRVVRSQVRVRAKFGS